jgi:hypothetical protein
VLQGEAARIGPLAAPPGQCVKPVDAPLLGPQHLTIVPIQVDSVEPMAFFNREICGGGFSLAVDLRPSEDVSPLAGRDGE